MNCCLIWHFNIICFLEKYVVSPLEHICTLTVKTIQPNSTDLVLHIYEKVIECGKICAPPPRQFLEMSPRLPYPINSLHLQIGTTIGLSFTSLKRPLFFRASSTARRASNRFIPWAGRRWKLDNCNVRKLTWVTKALPLRYDPHKYSWAYAHITRKRIRPK